MDLNPISTSLDSSLTMPSSIDHKPQQPQQLNPQNLRKTFRNLKNYTSTLANFVLQWQDLEDHFLYIKTQLQHLEEATHKSNTQQSFPSPIKENGDTITKPSIQSQNENTESKIHNLETKAFQIEFLDSLNNEGTIEPPKNSSLPIDNGKSLLSYFNEHVKEHHVLRSAIFEAFKNMPNPGKLVLQALRFFYPCNSSKLELGVDLNVTRNSCVVFLEELNRVGCSMGNQERDAAIEMALEWKAKMKNSLELLGFLMLVAVFGIVEEFDKDETFKYFGNVVQREQAPVLFRAFGFADKAHDFIQKLIDKNKRLEAVPFIYEFELVGEFPPVPLLRAHAEYAEECYTKICNKGNNSLNALDNATGTQLAALRGILKLIQKYKLQTQYSQKIIRKRILQLKKHKSEKKPAKTSLDPVVQPQQQSGNKRTALHNGQLNQHHTSKRLQMVVPTSSSTVFDSINTTISSKPQSYYQEAGLHRNEDTEYFPLQSGNATSPINVTSASFNTFLTSYPIAGQGAQHLSPSPGYNFLESSTFTVHNNSTGHFHTVGSALRTLPISSIGGQYGSGSCIPVSAHHFASTVGPYSSIPSTSFGPHMDLLDLIHHTNITNGDPGQLGSARFPSSDWHSR
ncbi:FRIGIDA-like protein 2 isoform X1 [Ricinus communis]|uniref:FRIGIDA-like protein 2 isoform X1 n=1 Tax=Ricinus communis TaxID=3988 RepID=UPI00201B1C1E|nr:FRIGIDA-like protein 2 isoform X1 [Ricinus communis]